MSRVIYVVLQIHTGKSKQLQTNKAKLNTRTSSKLSHSTQLQTNEAKIKTRTPLQLSHSPLKIGIHPRLSQRYQAKQFLEITGKILTPFS